MYCDLVFDLLVEAFQSYPVVFPSRIWGFPRKSWCLYFSCLLGCVLNFFSMICFFGGKFLELVLTRINIIFSSLSKDNFPGLCKIEL